MSDSVRPSAVAGQFYPGESSSLLSKANRLVKSKGKTKKVTGVILPHAGWAYSGKLAGKVISLIDIPKTVILLGVNHRGVGASLSVDGSESWAFPFGEVKVNDEIREELLNSASVLKKDSSSHKLEHSLEVIIPLLYAKEEAVQIVPIVLFHPNFLEVKELALAIAKVVGSQETMIIASTDMTHFKSRSEASRIDSETIEKIKEMDTQFLFNESAEVGRLCGVDSVVATLIACKELKTSRPELIGYSDSGEASGDTNSVVGYSGFIIGR